MKTLVNISEVFVICRIGVPDPSEVTFRIKVLKCAKSGTLRAHVYRLERCTFLVDSGSGNQFDKEQATHQIWVLDDFAWDPWRSHETQETEDFIQLILRRLASFEEDGNWE